ncbi:COG4315 family predicted lipoprotein [Pseudoxanthomonas dokdonensis]|uniref:COG4315 family predicted lipoprotein n=1 Tax=Pseudoxanthomonas dokdonensis TaxID=344882 RepID=UPI00070970C1|nr:hypothetical protein [Pseudoxanthomonas dokdonensis]
MRTSWLLGCIALCLASTGCGSDSTASGDGDGTEQAVRPQQTPLQAPPTATAEEGTALEGGPDAAGATQARVRLSQGSPSYLVDASGASLYFLQDNKDGRGCDAVCENAWPPVLSAGAAAETGVHGELLGRLQRRDGRQQLSYNGHPLYRYAGDAGAGRTSGHDVQDRWGHWQLLAPDGNALSHEPPLENAAERAVPAQASQASPTR